LIKVKVEDIYGNDDLKRVADIRKLTMFGAFVSYH
jgi:hypothetical protein